MERIKDHWNKIYATRKHNEVSWTQEIPTTSLDFIHGFNLPKDAVIIDVGGGESKFVDFLLEEGFTNITVLDISEEALQHTKSRLGEKANKVNWVISDVTEFRSLQKFDVWHDRATFHFLTTREQIEKYVELAAHSISENGFMTIGTFSTNGPNKCSGLDVKQYSEPELEDTLIYHFKKLRCLTEDHITPFQTIQNFLFCSFKKAA
ncbi:MAG TPA: class I SAM-dependent methyltransferase [Cyclobacteriaceae bacterium]